MREDLVNVKAVNEGGAAFASGRFALKLAPGEIAEKWADGSPITLAEFEAVLEQLGAFEIAGQAKAAPDAE